jgi:hypothetical protein
MRYRYYICDVFTDTRFGGNQLAALPEAKGLSDEQMQRISFEKARRSPGGPSHFSGLAQWPPFLRVLCNSQGAGFINRKIQWRSFKRESLTTRPGSFVAAQL